MIDEDFKIKVSSDLATVKTQVEEQGRRYDQRFDDLGVQINNKFDLVNKSISSQSDCTDKVGCPVKVIKGEVKRNTKLILIVIVAILGLSGKLIWTFFDSAKANPTVTTKTK